MKNQMTVEEVEQALRNAPTYDDVMWHRIRVGVAVAAALIAAAVLIVWQRIG